MFDGFNPYQAPRSQGDATEAPPSAPRRRFRARIIPATLALMLGGFLFVISCVGLYLLSTKPWPRVDPRIEDIFNRAEYARRTTDFVRGTLQLISGLLAVASSPFYMRARWLVALVMTALAIAFMVLTHPDVDLVSRLVDGFRLREGR